MLGRGRDIQVLQHRKFTVVENGRAQPVAVFARLNRRVPEECLDHHRALEQSQERIQFPRFGQNGPQGMNSFMVLDKCHSFYVNPFRDMNNYMLFSVDNY